MTGAPAAPAASAASSLFPTGMGIGEEAMGLTGAAGGMDLGLGAGAAGEAVGGLAGMGAAPLAAWMGPLAAIGAPLMAILMNNDPSDAINHANSARASQWLGANPTTANAIQSDPSNPASWAGVGQSGINNPVVNFLDALGGSNRSPDVLLQSMIDAHGPDAPFTSGLWNRPTDQDVYNQAASSGGGR
jgi:hypothetical protein